MHNEGLNKAWVNKREYEIKTDTKFGNGQASAIIIVLSA